MTIEDTYGVVANVRDDPTLRDGAKVWFVDGWYGGGLERVFVRGLSIPGDTIRKWIASDRLTNVRVAWVPDHLREKVRHGDRAAAEKLRAAIDQWVLKESERDDQD